VFVPKSPAACGGDLYADTDPVQACQTRRAFLERYCDTDVLICGSHFPAPSIGHIVPREQAFWFRFTAAAQ
jgi:hypothetical protein